MITEACLRGRALPKYFRAVLGNLDQFCCNYRIEPYEVAEHLFNGTTITRSLFHTQFNVPGPDESFTGWKTIIVVLDEKYEREYMSYIERIREEGRDANPFFCLMGISVVSLSEGKATLAMTVRDDMLNGEGYLQGGMFTALADEAMVLACYSVLKKDQILATISESTNFLRGAGPGDKIYAEGRFIKTGRRVAFAESDLTLEGSDAIISRSSAAFAISTHSPRP